MQERQYAAIAEDIAVYSIDGVFIDMTSYLQTYKMTARELTMTIINDIFKTTGITATAGIGTNLYLCKIAMDIMANAVHKHGAVHINALKAYSGAYALPF